MATQDKPLEITRTGGWIIFGLKHTTESNTQANYCGAIDASPWLPNGGTGKSICRDFLTDFPLRSNSR